MGRKWRGYFECALFGSIVGAIVCAPTGYAQTSPPPILQARPGQFVAQQAASAAETLPDFETDAPFSATYVGADLASVVNELLGEHLKIDYTIAPDAQGVVTMRVENLKSRLATLEALRTALRPIGIAVIDRGNVVAIGRGSGQDAAKAGAIVPGQSAPSGAGIVLLTPRYIAPSQLSPLIAPFAPGVSAPIIDDSRRFLLLKGDESAINAASKAAALFDVDWFSQISVGSFPLSHVSPSELISELKLVLGPAVGSVDLIAVPRLARIMVLARNPDMLRQVEARIGDLDKPNATLSPGLLIYRAKHVGADQLAKSLRETGGGIETPAQLPAAPANNSASFPTNRGLSGSAGSQSGGFSSPSNNLAPTADLQGTGSSGGLVITSNLSQNIVIVRGASDQVAQAQVVLDALDQPPVQVLIEAAVVEVTLNNDLEYGVNWSGVEDRFRGVFTDAPNGAVTSRFPGFALTYVNTDIQAALSLLAAVTKVEVMSRPSVMAINNVTANLQVGDEVPIVTQTAVSVNDPDAPIVNQTTYRDTGVILSVVPRVRSGGMVEIEVQQEVSQVARTTSSGIDSPTIQQRRIGSTLMVPSGKSVALGGLISTNRTKTVVGIPLLKDIPLLGQLFRTDSSRVERTELIVFLTPRVLTDASASVEATEQMRAAFRKLEQELAKR